MKESIAIALPDLEKQRVAIQVITRTTSASPDGAGPKEQSVRAEPYPVSP